MMIILLSQQKVALVSRRDFNELSKFKWYAKKNNGIWYAMRHKTISKNVEIVILMHREILGVTDPKILTDHKDGNGLNNYRGNLRIASPMQNCQNRRKTSFPKSSRYKGVSYDKVRNKWRSEIQINRVRKLL